MVATRDIGRVAAEMLVSPPQTSEVVDVVGPTYSARQVSQKLGAALGKPLHIVDIPASGHVEALVEAGLSRQIAEVYAEMYAAIGSGLITEKGDRRVRGTTTIHEVIAALVGSA